MCETQSATEEVDVPACEVEWTIPQTGQFIRRSPAQVARLITLGLLEARRDERGWWRVSVESAHRYADQQIPEPIPAA